MTSRQMAESIASVLREGYQNIQQRGSSVNEAVTRSVLIDEVLKELGYPPVNRTPEDGDRDNRPDYSCFLKPVSESPVPAALIVEAKTYQTDFDRAGARRTDSPDRQIKRYLKQHGASGPRTMGVLTDGIRWRLYRRAGSPSAPDIGNAVNFDFLDIADPNRSALYGHGGLEQLQEFIHLISWPAINAEMVPSRRRPSESLAGELFALMSHDSAPHTLLGSLVGAAEIEHSESLADMTNLSGIRKDAHDNDWTNYAYAEGPALETMQAPLSEDDNPHRVITSAVQFAHQEGRGLDRGDVALCARAFAAATPANASVTLAYMPHPDGTVSARLAASAAGQVNMTAEFDPVLPSPSARAAIEQQLRLIRDTSRPLNADSLLSPLAVATLRQKFYTEIANWTSRVRQGQDLTQRQATLRHLIRVMFAWILKEENIIPPEIFEPAFNDTHLTELDKYHGEVLRFLFHERLNIHPERRGDHPVHGINAALDSVPFLNGSLFAEQDGDDELDLKARDYWSVEEETPGLFTILSRYHWTMDEHRPGESEQTLDPELLSNLFERLIAPTEKGGESPSRQPQGTYYTPADVADEMVKDALSAAVKDHAGPLDGNQLLDLFGDSDTSLPPMSDTGKERLAGRIRELRIFDPAVGSGEFLFSTLLALQRALKKLEGTDEPAEAIIRRQLRGQDINPLAVQIARLRLFIAITASRDRDSAEPLPNLEAVIVCADTLETVADPQWRQNQLDMADPNVAAAVAAIAETRALWFDAHSEDAKTGLLQQYSDRCANLEQLLQQRGELASRELREFVKAELIGHTPAKTDARLLFHEDPWRGFDIVIGNPPYEALSKSMSADARKRLADEKRYRTTGGGDLYNLFCETALALAKPDGGVVTLIVPLSIAFGRNKQTLRNIFNQRSNTISLRHYNNRPDTTFNASPTVKTPENAQRATIVTATLGNLNEQSIESTGLQGWPSDERQQCIQRRSAARIPTLASGFNQRIAGQWARIPTKEIADMVQAIAMQKNPIGSYVDKSGKTLAFPKTARYFISSLPVGTVSPRSESLFTVANENHLRLAMAVLNGHIAYGWWRVYGDGFHVNAFELTTIAIPDAWVENPQPAIAMGQRLIDAMPDCIVENKQQGDVWQNVDFHTYAPALIEELDLLHIAALGLPVEPLLTHLRIMRSSSSWNYPPA